MKTTTHKTVVLGVSLLGIGAAMSIAQTAHAAPRNHDVKQARKAVKQERKELKQARKEVRQERREDQRYNRPGYNTRPRYNTRPTWNNRPTWDNRNDRVVSGPINITGIVVGGSYSSRLTVRGDDGRNYVVQGNNDFDRRINVGDRVRVEGDQRNATVFAERVTLLENRR